MKNIERQYLDLVHNIWTDGREKSDRTGTGTRQLFGAQLRQDLSRGFPLITTKKVHFRSVVAELLWFLSGSTNNNDLEAMGCTIWREWADPVTGELGPIYGHQFRRAGAKPSFRVQPKPNLRSPLERSYLGVANGAGKSRSPLGKTWEGMIARCYNKKSASYKNYGGRGVFVCDRWLEFSAFEEDASALPGYGRVVATGSRLVLDKDLRGNGFEYGPSSCAWLTDQENAQMQLTKIYVVERDGVRHEFANVTDFCRKHGIESSNFSDLWTGNKNAKKRSGFSLVEVRESNQGIDQIARLIDGIKRDPHGRRHVVSSWNPVDVPGMALSPCHALFQFDVTDGKLSCQLYQRSCDMFLGVPFNIASYALLTHMVAQQCDLLVGDFVWTGGDCHAYKSHEEQIKEQLKRDPFPLPSLKINHRPRSIFEYRIDDFELVGYEHHPAIKAPVAV